MQYKHSEKYNENNQLHIPDSRCSRLSNNLWRIQNMQVDYLKHILYNLKAKHIVNIFLDLIRRIL